ncbi:MAG: GNAT family N-acetyltransferase [Flavobacteriaceae bacterium]
MKISIKTFQELTTTELYDLLQLRSEVFVVEQDCVYQDVDGKDDKALHVMGYKNNVLIGYSRLFKPGNYFSEASIGRVIIKASERKFGYGHALIQKCIDVIETQFKTKEIHISAQTYLQKFYESHGFVQIGEGYLEDEIPHIKMVKE